MNATSADYPTGTVVPIIEQYAPAFIESGEWLPADGSRLYRSEDPELYYLLRPTFRRKWRRWIVHVPDFRPPALVPRELIRTVHLIRTSVPADRSAS